jgi:hypothetical protein
MDTAETASPAPTETVYAWRPQPGPQKALIDCPYAEILFGGARGGGKTDGILGKYAVKEKHWGRYFNAVFFRKEMPQQDDLIERAKEIYLPTWARWSEGRKQFLMPHGGRIRFRPLENEVDAQKYQGQNLSDAAVEEAGNYASSAPIDMLFGALRSPHGVPVQLILSANPGGPGHHWLKQRFIDPAPAGFTALARKLKNGATHNAVYIPSLLQNNRILLAKDPQYINRLHLVGSDNLVRAWLEGDWSVLEGAFFTEFEMSKHVVAPVTIPRYWARIRAGDWGSARPFCVLWLAVADGVELPQFPRGALIVYREWYGWSGEPNVGCKMTATQVGTGVKEREREEKISDAVLDPSAFAEDGGPSIAERMANDWRPADNRRVRQAGAMGGWDQVRERLRGAESGPMLYIFNTCTHLIRTLPALQHDRHRAEDVDTESEDHAPDALRYGCMSRPYVRDVPKSEPRRFEQHLTISELIKRQRDRRIGG